MFQQEIGEIYRLKIPFENLYTSVFLIKNEKGNILIDTATTDKDVDEWIVPGLAQMGLTVLDIKHLVLTHNHSDHTGGLNRILMLNPNLHIVVNIGEKLPIGFSLCALKGHTLDCIGVLDERSGTLISGDGLQGAGIGKYRCSLEDKEEYIRTINNLTEDKRIENILFSHAYEPWYKDKAIGRWMVEKVLDDCIRLSK